MQNSVVIYTDSPRIHLYLLLNVTNTHRKEIMNPLTSKVKEEIFLVLKLVWRHRILNIFLYVEGKIDVIKWDFKVAMDGEVSDKIWSYNNGTKDFRG